jgi:antitoxin component YwqK of YwqJK toxin-antitoxin module
MRYDENALVMLDLDSEQASWDEAGDCLLQDGAPFTGWAFENYEDGQLYSRVHYERGYPSGESELYYENGQLMRRSGDYDSGIPWPITRSWSEEGQLLHEEMNRSTIRVPAYQKEWSEQGGLIYQYTSPATYQSFKHGTETWWYEDGKLKEQKTWMLGICMEHQQWAPDGVTLLHTQLSADSDDQQLLITRKEKEAQMAESFGKLPTLDR